MTRTLAWPRRLVFAALLVPLFQACAGHGSIDQPTAASGSAGTRDSAGASGNAGKPENNAGLGGEVSVAGADSEAAGAGAELGLAGSAGASDAPWTPADTVETGHSTVTQTPRPSYGALLAVDDGPRTYVVESRRDVEAGPFGLPWRSRFRLAAYERGELAWAYTAEPDDVIGDVVVHPSGDVTLSLERHPPERNADDLVRLTRQGQVISTTTLSSPATIPLTDYGAKDPQPLFAMKSAFADATSAGWVRLLPEGEGLVVAFLSFSATPNNAPLSNRMAIGLETLDWKSKTYVERWARVVEGQHFAQPTAWTYDEFRWTEQAIRPFLARDESTGDLLVGRAWNQTRCQANVAAFAEFTTMDCMLRAVSPQENERLPLAVTRFDSKGKRQGTRVLWPDPDAAEQLAFALAARNGELAVVGSVVRELPDGSKRTYPDPSGYVDYDGYVSVYDAEGVQLRHHDYNLGRGDVLAGMRWVETGIVAVGAGGWDRWQGGMSISRGGSPFFAWFSQDGTDTRLRSIPLSDGSRHWNLHDVLVRDGSVFGFGFADAPMTHSADGGQTAARTFGSLQIELE